jgi:acetate kinase
LDAVVFTGGIGENSSLIRKACCENMEFFGISLDAERNESKTKEKAITADGSTTTVLVIPTNEELVIALDTMRIVKELKPQTA